MRASSLSYNTVAVNREIDSIYDAILYLKKHIGSVTELASLDLEAIANDIRDATDFTGISVVAGSVASWDSVTKVLTVPTLTGVKGETGDTGSNGLTPLYEFTYNGVTGNLEYTLVGYEDQSGETIGEIVNGRLNATEEW